jgi:hypothetical protein
MRDAQFLENRLHSFNRAKRGKKRSANFRPQLGRKLPGDCVSQRFIMLNDRSHASSKKQIERLIQTNIDAVSLQDLRQATATQHLTIDQYAVAVENDEIRLGHRMFSGTHTEHMLTIWATTHKIDPQGLNCQIQPDVGTVPSRMYFAPITEVARGETRKAMRSARTPPTSRHINALRASSSSDQTGCLFRQIGRLSSARWPRLEMNLPNYVSMMARLLASDSSVA